MIITPVAHFHSPFGSKFGVPKQSGLVNSLRGTIVMEPEYRDNDYLRGIEHFDYLWLLWEFSANRHHAVSPVVRPPRLGGNRKMGVFATRSPFRPNNIGLSSVKIDRIEWDTKQGTLIHVLGADLMDGTPIFDIKPYIEYADAHIGIRNGFVDTNGWNKLEVIVPEGCAKAMSQEELQTLINVLALDPRPHYQHDSEKVYGMTFMNKEIRFVVIDDAVCIVKDIT